MKLKQGVAALLTACLLCGGLTACGKKEQEETPALPEEQTTEFVQPVFDQAAAKVNKTETVYVNLNADGKATQINVSDWLHTDAPNVYVDDLSDLKDITNVKSEIRPVEDGERLRWNMPETDLYYSGKGDRALPLDFKIQYQLDGKPVTADQLGGQSGEVEIKVSMENKEYRDVVVNGAQHRVYLPLLVVGGMILPEGVFSAVTVDNGQSIGDGSKEICVFMGMPGFAESLGIADQSLGEIGGLIVAKDFTIHAHAENFSLTNMYFAALPLASLNFDFAMPDTVEDLKSTFAALKTFQNALNQVDPDRVLLGLLSDQQKVSDLMRVLTEAMTLYSNNRELLTVLGKYATAENFDALKDLMETLNDPEMQSAMKLLSDPTVQLFFRKLPELMAGFESVSPILEGLQTDLQEPKVAAQVEKLPETMNALNEITKVLNDNADAINVLVSALNEDGTQVLESLLQSIDLSDFAALEEKYGAIAENGDVLLTLAEAWLKFGKDYGLYTKATDQMAINLAFVFNTPSISGKAAETTVVETTEAQPWYKKIFA